MTTKLTLALTSAVLAFAIAGTPTAHADYTRHSCRGPTAGPIEAIVDDNACVGYRIKASDGSVTRTVSFPFKGSGDLIASDDGRTVVMLQSYLDGFVDDHGNVVGAEGDQDVIDPIGIRIFRDGVLVKTHRVHELLGRKQLVNRSTSHVRWIREAPSKITGSSFTLATTSFRTVRFDVKSGRILEKKDAPAWKRCTDIVVGTIDLASSQLTSAYSLRTGKRTKVIAFERDPAVGLTDKASETVCLERLGRKLVLTGTL
ncbi:MAG TPA: hypothetical protein VIU61_03705 [Kofleriaceae bacterium]